MCQSPKIVSGIFRILCAGSGGSNSRKSKLRLLLWIKGNLQSWKGSLGFQNKLYHAKNSKTMELCDDHMSEFIPDEYMSLSQK